MILCIDSGNTRIKWGWRQGNDWLGQDALPQSHLQGLAEELRHLPVPEQVMVANVAGPAVGEAIAAALAPWPVSFAQSEASRAGVTNGYAEPIRLGVDRWCALVGARQQTDSACLVVGAGTATTIDSLDGAGRFLGGLILPGLDLMRSSLACNTAGLPLAAGKYQPFPRCTDDAIATGCLEAQVGAIERAFSRLAGEAGAQCLLFGGAASRLAAHLDLPCRQIDTLVLDGLFHLATLA